MRRRDLLEHLQQAGCQLVRESGEHSIWGSPSIGHRASIPRHREIPNYTAERICKQPGVPSPFDPVARSRH
ncbi:MAG: type II toxin-antitoxin system HicA family toxin [Dehalococcoidia bacterium]|nr:type II toxin-antitoxin system HicA family toxin [Dehalococcoidia bacterium]